MNNNERWLRRQCMAFLGSELNHIILISKAGLIRDAAKKRGITDDEVSAMYRAINKERAL